MKLIPMQGQYKMAGQDQTRCPHGEDSHAWSPSMIGELTAIAGAQGASAQRIGTRVWVWGGKGSCPRW